MSARRHSPLQLVAVFIALAITSPTLADSAYPTRTVRIVVPFAAGGTADVVPRLIGEQLGRKWGQPVVIENRPGAGGNIGAEAVSRAEPDGYTLMSAPPPPLVINQSLYPKLGYDPAEFEKIIVLARVPNGLVVGSKLAISDVASLIGHAKRHPGALNAAIAGNGTTSHLTSALFQMMADVKFQHVPYTGSAPALNDLVGGTIDLMFDNLGVSMGLVNGGKLRLLAVASPQRLQTMPSIPAIAETTPGFESEAFYAVVAPARTPPQITAKLNAHINEILKHPEIVARLSSLSAVAVGGTQQQAADYLRAEVTRWGTTIKKAGIRIE